MTFCASKLYHIKFSRTVLDDRGDYILQILLGSHLIYYGPFTCMWVLLDGNKNVCFDRFWCFYLLFRYWTGKCCMNKPYKRLFTAQLFISEWKIIRVNVHRATKRFMFHGSVHEFYDMGTPQMYRFYLWRPKGYQRYWNVVKVVNLLMLATPVLTALLWFIMGKLADYIDSDRAKCFKT